MCLSCVCLVCVLCVCLLCVCLLCVSPLYLLCVFECVALLWRPSATAAVERSSHFRCETDLLCSYLCLAPSAWRMRRAARVFCTAPSPFPLATCCPPTPSRPQREKCLQCLKIQPITVRHGVTGKKLGALLEPVMKHCSHRCVGTHSFLASLRFIRRSDCPL